MSYEIVFKNGRSIVVGDDIANCLMDKREWKQLETFHDIATGEKVMVAPAEVAAVSKFPWGAVVPSGVPEIKAE